MSWIKNVASLKLTLLGIILLAIGAMLSYDNRLAVSVWVLIFPLAMLAINLTAAIITNPRINKPPGLLTFHIALVGIVVLAAIGQLTYLDGHVELVEGQTFSYQNIMDVRTGPFHNGELEKVSFVQGSFTVQYDPEMRRGITNSQISMLDSNGTAFEKIVGDDRPLLIDGYRFYTTFNKGFSVMLSWLPNGGNAIHGTVNMPSYPLFDYKQDNAWTPTGGAEIKFWLQLKTGLDEKNAWELNKNDASGVLVVTTKENRIELKPGEHTQLPGGRLVYERLMMWMGYRIFYDPTLKWLFFTAITGVLGLSWHYWTKRLSHFEVANSPIKKDHSKLSYTPSSPEEVI